MAAPMEFLTENKLEYNFFSNSSGVVQFRGRADKDARIALTSSYGEYDPMYEVFIGGLHRRKPRSIISKNCDRIKLAEVSTPRISNGGEFREFWVRWNNETISAGNEGDSIPFLSFTDSEMPPIKYVRVETGSGASDSWVIERSVVTDGVCWVSAHGGDVPPGAYPGGEENGETMYIIRANFQGGLIPGKLLPRRMRSYIPSCGGEVDCHEYEVLCEFGGNWQQCSGDAIPNNAVAAGHSEDGEPLYVGRALHEGALTVGKVQASHGVCYIPYRGQEIGFADYEILVS